MNLGVWRFRLFAFTVYLAPVDLHRSAGGFRRQVFVGLGKRHVVNSYRGTDARRYRGSWQAYVTARCPSVLQLSLEMASILPSFETPVANEAWIQAWAGICSAST